jgi:hypothetical protein
VFQWLADKLFGPFSRFAAARAESEANERRIADISRDLHRWVADRDRELGNELRWITNAAPRAWKEQPDPNEGSQLYSGAHVRRHAEAQRRALHQYRDEASRKQREVREVLAAEGRAHKFWRRRRGGPEPRLALSAERQAMLRRWREPATNPADPTAQPVPIDDPTRPEIEPELAELERDRGGEDHEPG